MAPHNRTLELPTVRGMCVNLMTAAVRTCIHYCSANGTLSHGIIAILQVPHELFAVRKPATGQRLK